MREKTEIGNNVDLEQFLTDIKVVVQDCQELLKVGVNTMKEQARTGALSTHRAIKESPYQTIGLAFGVGLLVGLLAWSSLSRRAND
jgi:ElaB/YqjD/DUF883 family membrane-anchored ribosome-binding protein